MENWLALIPGLFLGIALSASSGFRVFVPLLISNLAVKFGAISITPDFAWMASHTATGILSVACVAEIASYYVTYIDNLLDSIALPASVIAGTLLTSQFLPIDDPAIKWGLGLLAGGGVAGTIQSSTTLLRLASTKFTGGFGNAFVSSFENFTSVIVTILAIWLPLIMGVSALLLSIFLLRKVFKKKAKNNTNLQ
jgi:Domain of unknown function (DUF4126)